MDAIQFLSQASWLLARPVNLLLLVLGPGIIVLWVKPQASGRLWISTIFLALAAITILPVHLWVACSLEGRFPYPSESPKKTIDGVISLSSSFD